MSAVTTTAMNTEIDLMAPRYKVIADYPKAGFGIGHIYEKDNSDRGFSDEDWCLWYDKYPALFKKLPWYAEREESQMPEYVKFDHPDYYYSVQKIVKWGCGNRLIKTEDWGSYQITERFQPATLEDYQTFKKQNV